jgi:phosphate transport system substrate-binding protein
MAATLAAALVTAAVGAEEAGRTLRIQGSTTVNPVCAEAASELRESRGLAITVDPSGGSGGGVAALGDGLIDIAMSSKPVTGKERSRYPGVAFHETPIGLDAVAMVVSRPVIDGGVKALDRAQLRGLFEGRIASWKEVAGPDLPVFVFDKEPGRGTREVFDVFVYGRDKPPLVSFDRYAQVGGNEETRAKVAAHRSAISQLSVSWASGDARLGVVAVRCDDGRVARPTEAAVRDGTYPMARRLFLVTNGPPAGPARTFIDHVLSPAGQAIVSRHGYLPVRSAR